MGACLRAAFPASTLGEAELAAPTAPALRRHLHASDSVPVAPQGPVQSKVPFSLCWVRFSCARLSGWSGAAEPRAVCRHTESACGREAAELLGTL